MMYTNEAFLWDVLHLVVERHPWMREHFTNTSIRFVKGSTPEQEAMNYQRMALGREPLKDWGVTEIRGPLSMIYIWDKFGPKTKLEKAATVIHEFGHAVRGECSDLGCIIMGGHDQKWVQYVTEMGIQPFVHPPRGDISQMFIDHTLLADIEALPEPEGQE